MFNQNQRLNWVRHKDEKKTLMNISLKTHSSGVTTHLIINFEEYSQIVLNIICAFLIN